MKKKLYRNTKNQVIGGVCAGITDYFDWEVSIVRIISLILLFSGGGFVVYLAAWVIIPENPNYTYR